MVMNDMTDDGKWGAEIAVDGVRPEWLKQSDVINIKTHSGWVTEHNGVFDKASAPISDWAWMRSDGKTVNILAIRLPADHPHYQQTQPQGQTLTAQEHLARMEALVRRMAALNPVTEVAMMHTQEFDEARALVAEMEPAVDGDLVEARDLLVHSFCPQDQEAENLVLRAIKRGRELARGNVA